MINIVLFIHFVQFLPFGCIDWPATALCNNGQSMLVFQNEDYFMFNIVLGKWNIERIIWIAFYKNDENDKCLIDTLPKDIVEYVLSFLSLRSFCDVVHQS